MSKVIDLAKEAMAIKGASTFLGCPCGTEEGWQVVVVKGPDAPVVVSLVCNGCCKEVGVVWGIVN